MSNYDHHIYNTLIQIRDILELGFAKEIHEEDLKRSEYKASKENFITQIAGYVDEMISEGELKESDNHIGTRVSSCLTRAGITSFEEYDNRPIKELLKIRNFGRRTLKNTMKIKAWHERKQHA